VHQNVLDLGHTAGTLLLACYVIAGLSTAAAGLLPGNASRFRLLCLALGLALAGWATKVLLTGGVIIVGLAVLLVPVALTAKAITGTVRAYARRRRAALLRAQPHPAAARTYTEPFALAAATPAAPTTRARRSSGDTRQARFHGNAIAPPPAFPTPPRFAPQPLHNVPAPRPAPDDRPAQSRPRISPAPTASAPAWSLPAPTLPAPTPVPTSPLPAGTWPSPAVTLPANQTISPRRPAGSHQWARAAAWPSGQQTWAVRDADAVLDPADARDPFEDPSDLVAPAAASRMLPASMPDPSPVWPGAVRARHRAAGTAAGSSA
jgi:hypothetical protein